MNRLGSALGWGIIGLIAGALIGVLAGLALGVIRNQAPVDSMLDSAVTVGLIGAIGAAVGRLLEAKTSEDGSLTVYTFTAAIIGALFGALLGELLGAEAWLRENIIAIENQHIVAFLAYHVGRIGGAGSAAGMVLGILVVASVDTFFGEDASASIFVVSALLIPIAAIVAGFGGKIDWGTAIVIVLATAVIFYVLMKSGGGSSSSGAEGGSAGSGANVKGKGKPKS